MTEPSDYTRQLICFRVRTQEYGVDITDVREIRGWTPATPLPRTPSYVQGVINLRGAVLPIVDMADRLGLGQSEGTERHVIIVVCIHGQLVGLLVDAVCDILPAASEALHPTPDLVSDAHGLVESLLSVDGRMIAMMRIDALTPVAADCAA